MTIPLQTILFSIPALIYLALLKKRGDDWTEAFKKIGWRGSRLVYYLWSIGICGLIGGFGWLAFRLVPAEVIQDPNLNISAYGDLHVSVSSFLMILVREAFHVALGEEIFFRGWLGGWLVRRFSFQSGNLIQALAFLLPHLILLAISLSLLPIVIVQFIAGWLMGWLRHHSSSILPGWLAHSLINTLGAFADM